MTPDERLDEILADYMERIDRGESVDREALLSQHPELADQLREYFEGSDELEALVGVDPVGATSQAGEPSTEVGLESPSSGSTSRSGRGAARRIRYFGDYLLFEEIARGGMGVVYRARQESLNRAAALKMILSGRLASEADLRRFRVEAESAANLDHPNIVPIYEIGEHRGRHYYSMKLIPGGSLADRQGDWLDDPRRAAIIVEKVARAVQHAHARGILHRDLKPANVLIDDLGEPHVSDFGLAKRLDEDPKITGSLDLVGTPAYMAPEQTLGRAGLVTIATDVYGIGAVLYHLLTARPPTSGSSVLSTIDDVRNRVPLAPSRINARVPRDLEIICLKCLEKEPSRRYANAEAVADDLHRWLAGRPILAKPVGPLTRAWMWSKRHPALSAMTSALTLALVLGAVAGTLGYREVVRQRDQAEAARREESRERQAAVEARARAEALEADAKLQARRAEALNRFLTQDILAAAAPEQNARTKQVTVEEALDRAATRLDTAFSDDPEVNATVRATVAETYFALGSMPKAEAIYRTVLESRLKHLGTDHPETFTAWNNVAQLARTLGRFEEAEAFHRKAYEGRLRRLGQEHADTLQSMNNLASLLQARDQVDEAERLYRQALEIRTRKLGPENPLTLTTTNNLAGLLQNKGDLNGAERLYRQNLEARRRVMGAEHPQTLTAMNNLANVLVAKGRLSEGEPLYRAVLEARQRVQGKDHPMTLVAMNNLGSLLRKQGRRDEAHSMLEATLAGRRKVMGDVHPETFNTLLNLGELKLRMGKLNEAEFLLREAESTGQAMARRGAGRSQISLGRVRRALGEALLKNGKAREAEPVLKAAFEESRDQSAGTASAAKSIAQAETEALLGACLVALGRPVEGELMMSHAVGTFLTHRAEITDADAALNAIDRLMERYRQSGRHPEAARLRPERDDLAMPRIPFVP